MTRRLKFGFFTQQEVHNAAVSLSKSSLFSCWVKNHLKKTLFSPPEIVGISLLHAGQVIPAAAITIVARSIWPQSMIVWGGPHMSGLGKETILEDIPQRAFAADLFVTGHAESTFLDILESCESKAELAFKDRDQPRHLTGRRGKSTVPPIFQDLTCYDSKSLTLPAQSTLGCAYGRCAFCTYPAIEPTPTRLALDLSANSVICQAAQIPGASVAIKDSLVTPGRLKAISSCIDGRVPWSACTKLNEKLDLSNLRGLSTLEIGLESLLPETQRRIGKIQPLSLYENFVADAARVPGLSLVINYMTGFPWEDPLSAAHYLRKARSILEKRMSPGHFQIEHNSFELERLSPMAKSPGIYSIHRDKMKTWPWASVMEYNEG